MTLQIAMMQQQLEQNWALMDVIVRWLIRTDLLIVNFEEEVNFI